jgi:hypothetical protein
MDDMWATLAQLPEGSWVEVSRNDYYASENERLLTVHRTGLASRPNHFRYWILTSPSRKLTMWDRVATLFDQRPTNTAQHSA